MAEATNRSKRTVVRRILTASVVVVVLALVAVGAGRVVTSASDETRADPGSLAPVVPSTTPASPTASSTTPSPVPLVDVSFVDAETGHATPLPRSIRSIPTATQFAGSPDGRRLAFAAGGAIYIAKIDGTSVHEVAEEPGASAPSWSPDGEQLVFSDDEHVYVVDRRNERVERIATGRGHISHPNFSPDGRTVLFTMVSPVGLDLWTVPADGGRLELYLRLSMEHTNAAFGSFWPDGRVAYRRTQYDGVDITQMTSSAVWVTDRRGQPGQQVNRDGAWMSQIDPNALWPAWSSDGSKIAFERLYSAGVVIVDVRTGAHRLLGEGTKPTWVDDHTLIIEDFSRRSR